MSPFFSTIATIILSAVASVAAREVKLAIKPSCVDASLGVVGDVNVGLQPMAKYKTIVTFGDSYSQMKTNLTNGKVWNEILAENAGAKLISYANTGSIVDWMQYPGGSPVASKDFNEQVQQYFNDGQWLKHNAAETLYVVFFGMEDFVKSKEFSNPDASLVAGSLAYAILGLGSHPLYAKNLLLVDNYGRGKSTPQGDQYRADVFSIIGLLTGQYNFNVAFADFGNIWKGVFGATPGYQAFGYKSTGTCVTAKGVCADPAHTFYWAAGNPTQATHKILAEYVTQVISTC